MISWSDWRLWLFIALITIIILYLFVGRKGTPKPFLGLKPLMATEDMAPYRFLLRTPINTNTTVSSEDKSEESTPDTLVMNYVADEKQSDKSFTICEKVNPSPSITQNRFWDRSKGEAKCCEVMEKIYGKPFVKARPSFLRNPETGANLEIDCYNDELKIGVEYNGEQHYVYPNRFHRNEQEHLAQVRRDQFKLEACNRAGVYLITVPYTVKNEDIEDYIKSYLPENMKIKNKNKEVKIEICERET